MSIIACTMLVTTTYWWLAFFMPTFYRSRVLGEAGPNGESAESDA